MHPIYDLNDISGMTDEELFAAYPKVHGEFETLAKIREGNSIIRYDDGEFGVMRDHPHNRNTLDLDLSAELRANLRECTTALIGIPTMDPDGDKYPNWSRHIRKFMRALPLDREYWSALISRPDCGTWLRTQEYAEAVQSIWIGKNVLLIGPRIDKSKLRRSIEMTQSVRAIECPKHNAYDHIDEYERECLHGDEDLILLSCGVTATCLAARVSKHKQAVDIGSIGGFLGSIFFGERHGRYY